MGRAVILENLGEGKYRVEYRLNSELIEQRLEDIARALVRNSQAQAAQQVALLQAGSALGALDDQLRGLLSSEFTEAQKADLSRSIVAAQQAKRIEILGIQTEIENLRGEQLALESRQTDLERAKAKTRRIRELWSADYSPNLEAGPVEIGTIEVPGEPRETLLYPLNNTVRPWDIQTEGDLTPVIAQSPMAWLYNTCVFPGWQKYMPTYRFARVLEILSGTTMAIELIEPLRSSMDNQSIMPTNWDRSQPRYGEVTTRYLDCHAEAFTVGDEVVVQYEGQIADKPLVIGFRSHPQPCAAISFYTADGDRMRISEGQWQHSRQSGAQFGNMHWDNDKLAVSWHGWRKRYFPTQQFGSFPTEFLDSPLSANVYHRGQDYGPAPGLVVGAGIQSGYLLAVVVGTTTISLHTKRLDAPASSWSAAIATTLRFSTVNSSGDEMWFFNRSGTEATCSRFLARLSLSVQIIDDVIFGQFLPIEPAGPIDLGPDSTRHQRATDYVGDSLMRIDEIITGNLESSTRRYVCEAIGMDLLHSVTSRVLVGSTEIRQQTGRMVDYLDIRGGAGKIVALMADSNLTSVVSQTPSVTGTMHYFLILGQEVQEMGIRTINMNEGNSVDPTLAASYQTVEQGINFLWQHDTISDGGNGAIASLFDIGMTRTIPTPPLLFMGGDLDRYVRLGMG